jgi:hypothetical protein
MFRMKLKRFAAETGFQTETSAGWWFCTFWLSGFAIHDQLLREGYNVGINSVYVCLRASRDNTAKLQRQIMSQNRAAV